MSCTMWNGMRLPRGLKNNKKKVEHLVVGLFPNTDGIRVVFFFLDDRGLRISSDGEQIRRGVIYGIQKHGHRYIDNADVVHRGWELRKVDGSTLKVTTTRQIDETEAERLWKAQIEAAPKPRRSKRVSLLASSCRYGTVWRVLKKFTDCKLTMVSNYLAGCSAKKPPRKNT